MVFIPEQHYLWDFWLVSPHEWGDPRAPYHLYYLAAAYRILPQFMSCPMAVCKLIHSNCGQLKPAEHREGCEWIEQVTSTVV